MAKPSDGTKAPHHGLFYMENAGGHNDENFEPVATTSTTAIERQASCFAWEEEKGEDWKGSGATKSEIKDKRPSL